MTYLPENEDEAREVIEVEARRIILKNYTSKRGGGMLLNVTAASQEIADLIIKHARLMRKKIDKTKPSKQDESS